MELGFQVLGWGLRIWGVEGSGFRTKGSAFRVHVLGFGLWV